MERLHLKGIIILAMMVLGQGTLKAQSERFKKLLSTTNPTDLVFDSESNYYITNLPGSKIYKYNSNHELQYTISSVVPYGLAVDSDDHLLVITAPGLVMRHDKADGSELMRFGTGKGYNGFSSPQGIAVNGSDQIYVTDAGNSMVHVFNSSGVFQFAFGESGTGDGQYEQPIGIVIDASDNVFIADYTGKKITKVDASGNFISSITLSEFQCGLALDKNENIIASYWHGVRIFDGDFNVLEEYGSTSTSTAIGGFSNPQGLDVVGDEVYITGYNNNRVQVMDLSPILSVSTTERLTNGTTIDFGNVNCLSESEPVVFTIENLGALENLELTDQGGYYIELTGSHAGHFVVDESSLDPTLAPDETTSFSIKFAPTGYSTKTTSAIIRSNDTDEAVFTINLTGVGVKLHQSISYTEIGPFTYGDDPVLLEATASSGLAVDFYVVGEPGEIDGSNLVITGAGTIVVSYWQNGNNVYRAGSNVQYVTVNKAEQVMTFDALANMEYSETLELAAFTDTGLPITYSSSDESIAVINGSTLEVVGVGEVTITATQVGNENYLVASKEQSLTTTKTYPEFSFTDPGPLTYGTVITLDITSDSGLPIELTSEDESILLVDGHTVTVVGVGSTGISANIAGNEFYYQNDVGYSIETIKADQNINLDGFTELVINQELTLPAQTDAELIVVYTSSNPDILSVENNVITGKSAGTITLTVDQSGNENYQAFTTTKTLEVKVDDQSPIFSECPADITENANNIGCTWLSVWNEPEVTDNSGSVILSSTHDIGSTFTTGLTEVTYTAKDAAGNSSTCTFNVKVDGINEPIITQSGTVLTSDNESGNQWFLDNEVIDQATSQIFEAQVSGNYSVEVTNAFGCSAASQDVEVTILGAEEYTFNNSLLIYPNPVEEVMNVSLENMSNEGELTLEMFNSTGQQIHSETFQQNGMESVNLGSLERGTYLVRIRSARMSWTQRVMKK